MSEYPEHDKLAKVKDESQAIGEFLDFGLSRLEGGPVKLCVFREAGDNGEPEYVWRNASHDGLPDRDNYLDGKADLNPAYESWHEGYVPYFKPIQQILADYFDIDLDKIDAEKRAMLDSIQAANA